MPRGIGIKIIMPVTQTAKRALRVSKRKKIDNSKTVADMERAIRAFKKSASASDLAKAYSQIDRAARKNIFHKKKAARLKSQLSKMAKSAPAKASKKSSKSKTSKG